MTSRFQRLELLLGSENCLKIQSKTVIICGIGAVGSASAYTLARSGIQKFILIDFDKVDITNINRQFIAFESTIGQYKTEVMKKIILDINPNASVTIINEKLSEQNILPLLSKYSADFIIDAIDDINAKAALIKNSKLLNINIISSMGAAKKTDLTKIHLGSINSATSDGLAKALRKKLKQENIDFSNIKCVYSTEISQHNSSILLPSYMPITASFGIYIADYIIQRIIRC